MAIPEETAGWVRGYRLVAGVGLHATLIYLHSVMDQPANFFGFFTM